MRSFLLMVLFLVLQMHVFVNCAALQKAEASFFDKSNHKRAADSRRDDWNWVQHRKFNVSDSDEFQKANWAQYRDGFGDQERNEWWIGLDNMHWMTVSGSWRMVVFLKGEVPTNMFNFIIYDNVKIGSEEENYKLKIGSVEEKYGIFEEETDDFLMYNNGVGFATDRARGCGYSFGALWWYHSGTCFRFNPNGRKSEVTSNMHKKIVASEIKIGLRQISP